MMPNLALRLAPLVISLFAEEDGQDLIEYALLTSAIGFAGVAGINLLGIAINAAYSSWDTGVNSLWEVPDPGSTP